MAGNHEYYGHSIDQIDQKIEEICHLYNNVTYLNRKSVDVSDEYTIAGCTLWS